MPLPKPEEGEEKDDFMDRCLEDENVNEEFTEDNQRYAFCANTYEENKK